MSAREARRVDRTSARAVCRSGDQNVGRFAACVRVEFAHEIDQFGLGVWWSIRMRSKSDACDAPLQIAAGLEHFDVVAEPVQEPGSRIRPVLLWSANSAVPFTFAGTPVRAARRRISTICPRISVAPARRAQERRRGRELNLRVGITEVTSNDGRGGVPAGGSRGVAAARSPALENREHQCGLLAVHREVQRSPSGRRRIGQKLECRRFRGGEVAELGSLHGALAASAYHRLRGS